MAARSDTRESVLSVVQAAVADLTANPRNPRKIKPERLEQLKRALAADPDMLHARPIIALPDGTVIAGNQRLRAAVELGWDTIPVVYADLDERRASEWMLRDNRGFGEDDTDLTAALLAELAGQGADLDLTGFSSAEIDKLLRASRNVRDPDVVPSTPRKPRSKVGQVYELGVHLLWCGSNRDYDIPEGAVVTDLPYGVDYEGEGWDASDPEMNDEHYAWVESLGRSPTVYFCGSVNLARELMRSEAKVVIWHKPWSMTHSGIGNGRHHWEPIIVRRIARGSYLPSDVLVESTDRIPGLRDGHSCPKPMQVLADLIQALVPDRETVIVDPFAGSGTTLIAAETLGRRCVAVEIDPAYCDVIRQRYADYTGQPEFAP